MALTSINEIPEYIKNIVELYYAGNAQVALNEAERTRFTHPDTADLIDITLQIINSSNAPDNLLAFYDAFIDVASDLADRGYADDFSLETGDAPILEDNFFSALDATLATESTQDGDFLDPLAIDPMNDSLASQIRKDSVPLSFEKPEIDIDIDLDDVEIDASEDFENMDSCAATMSRSYSSILRNSKTGLILNDQHEDNAPVISNRFNLPKSSSFIPSEQSESIARNSVRSAPLVFPDSPLSATPAKPGQPVYQSSADNLRVSKNAAYQSSAENMRISNNGAYPVDSTPRPSRMNSYSGNLFADTDDNPDVLDLGSALEPSSTASGMNPSINNIKKMDAFEEDNRPRMVFTAPDSNNRTPAGLPGVDAGISPVNIFQSDMQAERISASNADPEMTLDPCTRAAMVAVPGNGLGQPSLSQPMLRNDHPRISSSTFSFKEISSSHDDPTISHSFRQTRRPTSSLNVDGANHRTGRSLDEIGVRRINTSNLHTYDNDNFRPTVNRMPSVPNETSRTMGGNYPSLGAGISKPGTRTKTPTLESDALDALQPLTRAPRICISPAALASRTDIDAHAGFILSLIDGTVSISDILSLSTWSQAETSQILCNLKLRKIIDFD